MAARKRGNATGRRKPKPKGTPPTFEHSKLPAIVMARRRKFLRAFGETGNVLRAAAMTGIDRTAHYRWLRTDERYREAFKHAEERAADVIEAELVRRAVEGVQRPVYQGGQLVGHVQEYSDNLMCLLVKGLKPEKYRERVDTKVTGKHEHRHSGEYIILPKDPFPDAPKT